VYASGYNTGPIGRSGVIDVEGEVVEVDEAVDAQDTSKRLEK